VAEAEELLQSMYDDDDGVRPDAATLSILQQQLTGTSSGPRSAEWVGAMREVCAQPDVSSFNRAVSCCARVQLPELALAWLEMMGSAGVAPNLASFSLVLSACAKAGMARQATALLGTARAHAIALDTAALNLVLEAHSRAEQPLQAAALLRRMERGEEGEKCRPDGGSYAIVILCLAQRGEVSGALALMERMRGANVEVDVGCYNAAIRGFAASGKMSDASQLLSQLLRDGLRPDEYTFGPLLDACRRTGKTRLALALGRQMLLADIPLSTFCLSSLRRCIGATQFEELCREQGVIEHPAVKQAVKQALRRPPARQGQQRRAPRVRG